MAEAIHMGDVKSQIREYFDENAGIYDTRHGVTLAGQEHNFARHYEPFLTAAIAPNQRVLELGSGTGVYSRWLADRGCSVTGMDISPQILEVARRRCPEAGFHVGDCEDPAAHLTAETTAEPFDVILGVNTFSYYPNKTDALARYRKLLRPGGRVVFIEMNGRCPFWRLMTFFNKNEIRVWLRQFSDFNSTSLGSMMRQVGLQVKTMTHFAFIPNGLGSGAVHLLRPFDEILTRIPGIRTMAMRVAVVAEN